MAARMGSLPLELVDLIYSYADDASKLALRLTCKSLNQGLRRQHGVSKRPSNSLNACYWRLVSRHLDYEIGRRTCVVCDQRYAVETFDSAAPPSVTRNKSDLEYILRHGFDRLGGPGMVPTAADICHHHRSSFIYLYNACETFLSHIQHALGVRKDWSRRWFTRTLSVCMHCKSFGLASACRARKRSYRCCNCDFCGVRPVCFFGRLMDFGEKPPRRYAVVRENGHFLVKEWYDDGSVSVFQVQHTSVDPPIPQRRFL
ncbi:uncharacterized protein PV09_07827 [Verruconis gallopava]|uniref:F-box domain-containing protein n=1 Tax=Verruconis gallopava TaxID=253628 RepID=A0A0D2A1N7_9PEZI|nr:uncharacterized protein PV09_07827 [Verruconis gallopava]KIW00633.1 hypothetical protein PV09_07827 [Verruconis gallopava]